MKKLATATVLTLALAAAPAAGVAAAADRPPAEAGQAHHQLRPRLARALRTAAEAIDIPAKELGRALRDGKSIAEVAAANEVDPQAVVDALVAAGTEKIDAAVASGRLDEERGIRIEERLDERVTRLVNAEPGPRDRHRRPRAALRRHVRRATVTAAAASIGVESDGLRRELRDGKSIADVAQANDVDPEKVVADLTASATRRIDAAVAAGKIREERAAALKEHLDERLTKLVNHTR
jgi:hypothetical protein